jgi:3-hydroxypropanoate dehydrogenase
MIQAMNTSRPALSDTAFDQLFRQAHTVHAFQDAPLSTGVLHALYDVMKWAPTAFNAQPARFVFLQSAQSKSQLAQALMPGNVPQVNSASVTVIVAYDTQFQVHLPSQFPAYDAKPLFDNNPALTESTAFRNSSLQGAYLMLAARAMGLDVGAMSGFDADKVNQTFFPDGRYRVNFLINLGVADPKGIYPRGPRLPFDSVASIL